MDMDKLAARAILSSLAAIGVLFVFVFCMMCAVFPSTMMQLTYNVGMENSCIRFAERAYKDNHEIYFIAYATEVAIEEDKREKLISCGEKFVQDDDFTEYCIAKGEGYKEFVCGRVSVAKYETGDKEGAISFAYESLDDVFVEGNAMVALLLLANQANDEETVLAIKAKIGQMSLSDAERTYLEKIYTIIDA